MEKKIYEICFDRWGGVLPDISGEINPLYKTERIYFSTWTASSWDSFVAVRASSLNEAIFIAREIIVPFIKLGARRGNYQLNRI